MSWGTVRPEKILLNPDEPVGYLLGEGIEPWRTKRVALALLSLVNLLLDS
jgi:hypothetical protein